MPQASFRRKEKRILAFCSLITLLLRLPLLLRPARELAAYPYWDDTFYLFSIAKHLAMGSGPSVDGVHLTNGFQPLIVLLYTPIFWLAGPNSWLAVRWTFVLGGIIAALFVWVIALLVRTIEQAPTPGSFSAPVLAAIIWTFGYPCFLQMTNGLETGLASLCILAVLLIYSREFIIKPSGSGDTINKATTSRPMPWLLGVMLGFAVLARIDAAILAAIIVVILLIKRQIRAGVITGTIAFLISLPWWWFNWVYFGSLMPQSGQAENIWPLPPHENIYRAIQSLSDILTLVVKLPDSISFPMRIAWLLLLVAGLIFLSIKFKLLHSIRKELKSATLLPLLLFSVALLIYYTCFFRAPHFLARYLQPARILWSIFFASGISALWKQRKLRVVIVLAAIASLAFFAERTIQDSFFHTSSDLYDAGIWASGLPQERVGMLQSGVASFVSPNVINLDGKVNDAALKAHQHGQLAEYIHDQHFTYIADDKPLIEDIAALARKDQLVFDSIGMVGNVQLMKLRAHP